MEHHVCSKSELGGISYRICLNAYTGKLFKQVLAKGIGKHGGVWTTAMDKVHPNDDPMTRWLVDAMNNELKES